jgi:multicomponent Na+:H+ antiporter subunit D
MRNLDPITLILMLPLLGAAGAFGLTFLRARLRAGLVVALSLLTGAVLSFFVAARVFREGPLLRVVGGWSPAVGIHLNFDGAAAVLLLTLFVVAFLVLLYALGEGSYGALFYGTYAIAVAGMAGVILSADLFNLFVFFEVLSLSATILIAYKRKLPGLYAAFRYLLVTGLSVVLYLLGVYLIYRESGELALRALFAPAGAEPQEPLGAGGGIGIGGPLGVAGVFLFSGVAIRTALVPFHAWLPDAHSQAPHPVSALLSGLVIKAAFIALWRMVTLFSVTEYFLNLLLITGVLSALLGVVLALAQRDPKRLLAFHSISQMGYIAAAAGAGALSGALYHAVGHALFKSLLFLVVGYYIGRTGSRDLYRMGREGGAVAPAPLWAPRILPPLLLISGAAAIAGLPPFTGFASKSLIAAAMKGSPFYTVLRIAAVGTAASFIKLCRFLLPITRGSEEAGRSMRDYLALSAMAALALLTLFLGLFPGLILGGMEGLGLRIPAGILSQGVYSLSALLESVTVFLLGGVVYLLLRSSPGRRLSQQVSERRIGVEGALGVMALGVVLATVPLAF